MLQESNISNLIENLASKPVHTVPQIIPFPRRRFIKNGKYHQSIIHTAVTVDMLASFVEKHPTKAR